MKFNLKWPNLFFLFLQLAFVNSAFSLSAAQEPLFRGHAHNDYYHKRPLFDALDQGFCSVEADVFLQKGELLVAHTVFEIRKERTLSSLYLDPLFERIRKKGFVHASDDHFLLLLDFKSRGSQCLERLNQLLAPHRDLLSRLEKGVLVPGKLTVVISGNRPAGEIVKADSRLVFLDGRLGDPKSWGPEISPLVSESWNTHFRYRGFGQMKSEEREKLEKMVAQVHRQKKRIRFWALPDREKGWAQAYESGVDLINTDKLEQLRRFLQAKREK